MKKPNSKPTDVTLFDMDDRTEKFLNGVSVAYPKEIKPRRKRKARLPRAWWIPRAIISLKRKENNKENINSDEFFLLSAIENLCYYDKEGNLHPFYGSNRYLSEISGCTTRAIQSRLAKLKKKGYLLVWTKTKYDRMGKPRTNRFICTKWSGIVPSKYETPEN